MEEIIRVQDEYYILSRSVPTDFIPRVLKDGETFGVYDPCGDFEFLGRGGQGLYHEGTRHLSYFEMTIEGQRPLLLNSHVKEDNSLYVVDLTNTDFSQAGEVIFPRDTLHIYRSLFIFGATCYQRFRIKNFASRSMHLSIQFRF